MFGATLKTKKEWANKVVTSCRIINTLFVWSTWQTGVSKRFYFVA